MAIRTRRHHHLRSGAEHQQWLDTQRNRIDGTHGKSSAGHILNGEFPAPGLLPQFCDSSFDPNEVKSLSIPYHWSNEPLLCSDSNADVDVVAVNDGITSIRALNRSVDSWDIP